MNKHTNDKFDFAEFLNQLEESALSEEYAQKTGTTVRYLMKHLKHRRKIPRQDLMLALAENSNGKFTYSDLVKWFYQLEAA